MGIFSRYRDDVARVGAAVEPIVGGTLAGPDDDGITWRVAGRRGERDVVVTLNHLHGIYGLECAVRELGVGRVDLRDDRSIFATSRQPHVAGRIKAETAWDAAGLWQLLPGPTRAAITSLLDGESSALSLRPATLDALLGPAGVLRRPDAVDVIVRDLDRLLAIAQAMEAAWDVDPAARGVGRRVWAPEPAPPPPPPVAPRDAAVIASLARPARDALVARHAADTIALFPAADPLRGRLTVEARVVVLPPVPPSRWVPDGGLHRVAAVGSVDDGWYFPRTDGDGFARALAAVERYQRATSSTVGDAPWELVGQLTGAPKLVVVEGSARFGLDVAVLGALIGELLFVDTTRIVDGISPYTGEHD